MAAPTSGKYSTSQTLGVNLALTFAPATSSNPYTLADGVPFEVGQMIEGTDGSEFMFVLATEAIAQYAAASIDKDSNASVLTLAALQAGTKYGFAQVAIASGYYGWVCTRGQGIGVLAKLGSLAGRPVYISSTSPGRVTTTSVRNTSGGALTNVVLTTSSTSTPSGATVANAVWPGWSRSAG